MHAIYCTGNLFVYLYTIYCTGGSIHWINILHRQEHSSCGCSACGGFRVCLHQLSKCGHSELHQHILQSLNNSFQLSVFLCTVVACPGSILTEFPAWCPLFVRCDPAVVLLFEPLRIHYCRLHFVTDPYLIEQRSRASAGDRRAKKRGVAGAASRAVSVGGGEFKGVKLKVNKETNMN